MITSADGQQLEANKNYATSGSIMYDALYIPGGKQGVDNLMFHEPRDFVNDAFRHSKTIGAVNEGMDILAASDAKAVLLAGADTKDQVYTDFGVITTRNAQTLTAFTKELIHAISQHRHWIWQIRKKKTG